MQQKNEVVKDFLEMNFTNVRKTETGFKFNKQQLNKEDLLKLACVPSEVDLTIKRSGTGLVVLID